MEVGLLENIDSVIGLQEMNGGTPNGKRGTRSAEVLRALNSVLWVSNDDGKMQRIDSMVFGLAKTLSQCLEKVQNYFRMADHRPQHGEVALGGRSISPIG